VEMMLWNMALTVIVGIMGFIIKEKFAEIQRLGILLNKTREEVARDHITRAEVKADLQAIRDHFDDGFKRLEAKIDKLTEANKG
jgi:hypothetical protein